MTGRTAWFHCFSGVAGDMALGALIDAGAPVDGIAAIVSGLGVPGWTLAAEPAERQGLHGTRALVGAPEDHEHHRPYRLIRERLEAAELPPRVKARSLAVFAALAEAEGALHGMNPDDVEFHEVGALDAIVDVVGTCAALELLGIDRVVCSPIAVGRGTISAAHGLLPNPAPAVVELAARHGLSLAGTDEPSELATPTGVALMAALATGFGALPAGRVAATGLGAGGRNPAHRPNVVQVVIVENETTPAGLEELVELSTNVDDVTGEVLAYTVGALLSAGALDAWLAPILMKKGRPAHTVHVLCRPGDVARLRQVLVDETGTLGVRAVGVTRWAAPRDVDTVEVDGHPVRVKWSGDRVKAEFDDAAAAASSIGRPLRMVQAQAEQQARSRRDG